MSITVASPRSRTTRNRRFRFGSATTRLWASQVFLAVVFAFAGISKLVMPAETLAEGGLSIAFLRFIGLCEAAGALGLVLPGILRIARGLTPLAAAGLAIIMGGAAVLTAANGDYVPAVIPLVIGVLSVYVVRGRAPRVSKSRRSVLHPRALGW